eukprot:3941509-Rhodomonas_salina.1
MVVSAFALATRCPVLTRTCYGECRRSKRALPSTVLCYAMPSPEMKGIWYCTFCYAVYCTEIGAIWYPSCYAVSGTEIGAIVLPGSGYGGRGSRHVLDLRTGLAYGVLSARGAVLGYSTDLAYGVRCDARLRCATRRAVLSWRLVHSAHFS